MNAKKYLKNQAESEKRQILAEHNGQVYQKLLEQTESNPKPRKSFFSRNSKWLISAAAVCASAIILVCVFVFYPTKDNKVHYVDSNFVKSSSTIEEMISDMHNFEIQIDTTKYSAIIKKTTDSVSGDTIYYTADVNKLDSLIDFKFVAVCNTNYTYKFDLDEKFIVTTLPNYSVTHKQTLTLDSEFGLHKLTAIAKIQKGTEFIYITHYNERMSSEEGSFLKIIQEIFI